MNNVNIRVEDQLGKCETLTVPTDLGLSLMEFLKAAGYPIMATCGGMALCATCHVEVLDGPESLREATDAELDIFDTLPSVPENSRLSCQMRLSNDMEGMVVRLLASLESETF